MDYFATNRNMEIEFDLYGLRERLLWIRGGRPVVAPTSGARLECGHRSCCQILRFALNDRGGLYALHERIE